MEKLAYYLLQPLRPENWKTQGATYLVLRKNEGLNAEKLTDYQLSYPGVLLTPQKVRSSPAITNPRGRRDPASTAPRAPMTGPAAPAASREGAADCR